MKTISSFSDREIACVANASGLLVDFELLEGVALARIKDSMAGPKYSDCFEYVGKFMSTGRLSEYEGW